MPKPPVPEYINHETATAAGSKLPFFIIAFIVIAIAAYYYYSNENTEDS